MINRDNKYYFFEKKNKFFVIDKKNKAETEDLFKMIFKDSFMASTFNTIGTIIGAGNISVTLSKKNNLIKVDDSCYYRNNEEIERYEKYERFYKFKLSLSNDKAYPIQIYFSDEHILNIKMKEFKDILLSISQNEKRDEYIKIIKNKYYVCVKSQTLIKKSLKIFSVENTQCIKKYVKNEEIICFSLMENFNCDTSIIFNYMYKTYFPNEFTYRKKLLKISKFKDLSVVYT